MSIQRALAARRCAAACRVPLQQRSYHSYEHDQPPSYNPAEDAILAAAIAHVPAYGFSITALNYGARDAGYLDVSTNLLPAGVFSLVKYHMVTQRLALSNNPPKNQSKEHTNVLENVRALTLKRLRANESIIYHWQEVKSLFSRPSYLRALAMRLYCS